MRLIGLDRITLNRSHSWHSRGVAVMKMTGVGFRSRKIVATARSGALQQIHIGQDDVRRIVARGLHRLLLRRRDACGRRARLACEMRYMNMG